MVVTVFHSLAQPTKANEDFWHAMIALVNTQERRSFEEIIRDVDAYYAAHPAKIPRSQEAAMASMAFGIKFALDKAQRRRQR
jgi:hypothetical protein